MAKTSLNKELHQIAAATQMDNLKIGCVKTEKLHKQIIVKHQQWKNINWPPKVYMVIKY